MDDRQKSQLARNEDLFRTINERIEDAAQRHGTDSHKYEFLCECSDLDCAEKVVLTLAEYAHAREDPTRFIVVKEHVIHEIEHVVEAARDHVVIEKHGEAGVVAITLDEASET